METTPDRNARRFVRSSYPCSVSRSSSDPTFQYEISASTPGPLIARGWRVELLAVSLAYSAIALWWLWPLPALWTDHSFHVQSHRRGDLYTIIWALAWDVHALWTRPPWRIFDANIFFPTRSSLAYSDHFLGLVPLFGPIYALTRNRILSINLVTYLTYPLCASAMYCLARRWMGRSAAFAAGFLYAFCVWRYALLPHVHVLAVQYMPLSVLLTDRWLEARRWRAAALLSVVLALQMCTSFYLAYALLLMYLPITLLALWHWRRRLDRVRLIGLGAALLAATGVVALTAVPYLRLHTLGLIPSLTPSQPLPYFMLPFDTYRRVTRYLRAQGIGWIGYAAVLVALVPPWRGRGWPVMVGVTATVIGLVFALGPLMPGGQVNLWSPYRLLMTWVPGFATIRFPERFLVVAQLGFALLAGLGLARLAALHRFLSWPLTLAVMSAVMLGERSWPALHAHNELTTRDVPPAYFWLTSNGGGRALLEWPQSDLMFSVAAHRMYMSTYHWLPIVEGFSGYMPGSYAKLYSLGHGLPATDALQSLVDAADVGWILVHGAELSPSGKAMWQQASTPGLERAAAFGDDLLFRVTMPGSAQSRDRFVSTEVTRSGTRLARLDTCAGRIDVIDPPTGRQLVRSKIALKLAIINQGGSAWPAESIYSRHTVELRVRTASHQRGSKTLIELPFERDVAPGEMVSREVTIRAPHSQGAFGVDIDLFQRGDQPMSDCGIAPVRLELSAAVAGGSG